MIKRVFYCKLILNSLLFDGQMMSNLMTLIIPNNDTDYTQ